MYQSLIEPVHVDPEFARSKWGEGQCVSMNTHAEINLSGRIYTFGLCGCHCALARRGDTVQLSHYSPLADFLHAAALRAFRPDSVVLWTPGEWLKTPEGGWIMAPASPPPLLKGLCQEIHGYDTMTEIGCDRMVDYNAGLVTAFRTPVTVFGGEQNPSGTALA